MKETLGAEKLSKEIEARLDEQMTYIKAAHASTAKYGAHNDYVYYRTFQVISKKAGQELKWKRMAKELLNEFPGGHLRSTIKEIDARHSTDFDKCFEVLMTWKVFIPGEASIDQLLDRLKVLKLAISEECEEIMETYEKGLCSGKSSGMSKYGLTL